MSGYKVNEFGEVIRPEKQNFLNVSTTDISFPKSGGTRYIDVSSYPGWQISVEAEDWVKITQEDNRIILFTYANSQASERTDYFKIKAGSIEKKINIRQAPNTQSSSGASSYSSSSSDNLGCWLEILDWIFLVIIGVSIVLIFF